MDDSKVVIIEIDDAPSDLHSCAQSCDKPPSSHEETKTQIVKHKHGDLQHMKP